MAKRLGSKRAASLFVADASLNVLDTNAASMLNMNSVLVTSLALKAMPKIWRPNMLPGGVLKRVNKNGRKNIPRQVFVW